ncbi:MAG: DMT family transporter [Bacteroidaceae bacterium]|nr:DMT family transporter [Bacteroidaceae bacterium]
MWLTCAFLSALLLGFYDASKKFALRRYSVIPVLFLNTLLCSLIFLVPVLLSRMEVIQPDSSFFVPSTTWSVQRYVLLKSLIVLSSWMCGYYGMKHLPLTIVGPINATRPVIVLLGALLIFGERLNGWQWLGVLLAIVSFYMLSRSGRQEGIDFRHNRWILCVLAAAVLGALSGLYDKYLMASPAQGGVGLNRMVVQSYYNFYQCLMMGVILIARPSPSPTRERGGEGAAALAILFVSLFLSSADFVYFYALSLDGALVSVVSMVRRGSVVVSFLLGAALFHEKNLRSKTLDLALLLLSLLFLWIGTNQ